MSHNFDMAIRLLTIFAPKMFHTYVDLGNTCVSTPMYRATDHMVVDWSVIIAIMPRSIESFL